jgi:hypothetical protein
MSDMSASGDEDRWILLQRNSADNYLLIVRSRLNSEISDFAETHRVSAVICDVHPEFVRDDGMTTCLDELHKLEDDIVAALGETGKVAYHTASVTGDGRRVIYIASEPSLLLETALSAVRSDHVNISIFTDFEFDVYRDFITPTNLDIQLDGDRGVIANLEKNGDECVVPRKTDFWFYGARSGLENLVSELARSSYVVDRWLDNPVGVVLAREMPVDFESFTEVTPELVRLAAAHNVTYDGWETFVIRPDEVRPTGDSSHSKSWLKNLFGRKQ